MASHVLNSATPQTGVFLARLAEWKRQFQALRERRQYRDRIRHELMAYTDRELADIGLTRSDIPEVVRGTFRR